MRQRANGARAGRHSRGRWLWGVALAAIAAAVAVVIVFEPTLLPPPPERPTQPAADRAPKRATPFFWPGIQQPPTLRVAESPLADDEDVIGVSAGSRHRAYRVAAFRGIMSLVVNDLLAGEPVTVTVCDHDGCVRVFTADTRGQPLDVWLGGFDDGMLLRVNDKLYRQANAQPILRGSKPFPYRSRDFVRTVWQKWRAIHPDTDVYVGWQTPPNGMGYLTWELVDDHIPTQSSDPRASPPSGPRNK